MKHSRLAKAIYIALPLTLLAGCNEQNTVEPQPHVLQFDPANGLVPYPNDIVGFDADGTLSIPGETDWANIEGDSANTYWNFLGSQKGWGTSVPIILQFDQEPFTFIDETTLQSGVKMFKEVDGNLTELEWNTDYRAIISQSGTLNIEPLKPFDEASRYFFAVTTNVKDGEGNPLLSSDSFLGLMSSDDEMGEHLQQVISSLGTVGIEEDSLVYAADFTTGSSISMLRPIVDKYLDEYSSNTRITLDRPVVPYNANEVIASNPLVKQFTEMFEQQGVDVPKPEPTTLEPDYITYVGTVNLPSYMDSPEQGVNCDYNPYVESMQGDAPENMNEYRVAPQKFCPGAYSFFQTDVDGQPSGKPISADTAENIHVFKEPRNNPMSIVVHIPTGEMPEGGWPVIMLSHGFGGKKEDSAMTAETLAPEGYVVVAIDTPMHGERMPDIDHDGEADLTATKRRTDYASPENLLTTSGFMWQLSLDYLAIRMAITNGIELDDGSILQVNNQDVHMSGGSLGGIHSTIISSLIRDTQERHSFFANALDIRTTTLNVPGGGVASVLMQSPGLKPELKADILDSAAFRLFMAEQLGYYNPVTQLSFEEKVAALDEVDKYRASFSSEEEFAAYEEEIWQKFEKPAEVVYQSITDPNDPINFAKELAKYKDEPILLNEGVGDGSNEIKLPDVALALATDGNEFNPGDFIIVNQTQEMPLGGTDPLIRVLELDLLTGDMNEDDVAVRGAGRYGYANHLTPFIPLPLALVDPDLLPNDAASHRSMMHGMTTFLNSKGKSVEVKNVGTTNGDALILAPEMLPEQPEYKDGGLFGG
ncbi:hypothetical protein C9I98_00650 [Photobacterium sanctipauli]|uniref:Bacterial virulence factor lipase N-terminal domain-containing protein n=1 Tax=Photobacterium sanctipauli TaxID=1342794 RepID=A0A2T3NZY8_9GAMM|nr:hypothetical protein [Photobacterium sanctipauli]PSW21810.1 hypothetical protein C9I98_00650 [Photobacterium sanctipauli]